MLGLQTTPHLQFRLYTSAFKHSQVRMLGLFAKNSKFRTEGQSIFLKYYYVLHHLNKTHQHSTSTIHLLNILNAKEKPSFFARVSHIYFLPLQPLSRNIGHWRDGRVVDYNGLENRRTERYRGFESLSLR